MKTKLTFLIIAAALAAATAGRAQTVISYSTDGGAQALETGSPALDDALVNFDCRIAQTHEVGSHSIFYCEVVRVRRSDPRPPML